MSFWFSVMLSPNGIKWYIISPLPTYTDSDLVWRNKNIYKYYLFCDILPWSLYLTCTTDELWWVGWGGGPTDYFVTLNLIWGWVEAVAIVNINTFIYSRTKYQLNQFSSSCSQKSKLKNIVYRLVKYYFMSEH